MSVLAVSAASKEVLRNEGQNSSFLPGSQESGIFLPVISIVMAIIGLMKNEPPDLTETELATETVFKGRLMHVKRDRVRLPDGGESSREYIVHPGAVVVIPVFENGDLLLERQHRYPLRRDFIEFPAGKIDPGEDDLTCAKRELEEETGYTAREWREVTTIYPCIGYSDERLAFYLARGLEPGNHGRDPDEFLEILRVPFGEAMGWLRSGKICETKTVIGLFWLEKILDRDW
jgi:ADP-ribose pyrophosphatase